MTAREYLEQYREAVRRAERYHEEYRTECILIDSVRSLSDNDGMPHGTHISNPTEEKAIRLADKALQWKFAELDAIAIRQEIFETVDCVPGLPGDVLYHRFVNLRKWEDVCDCVHYSWETVRDAWHEGERIIDEILSARSSNNRLI